MTQFLDPSEFETRYRDHGVPPKKFVILLVEDNPERLEPTLPPVVEQALAEYLVQPEDVEWYLARSGAAAVSAAQVANTVGLDSSRGYRGFDAVFCDLEIPWANETPSVETGFNAAKTISGMGWPTPIVALSVFTEVEQALGTRRGQLGGALSGGNDLVFEDFLLKDRVIDVRYEAWAVAKLKQILVPTGRFASALGKLSADAGYFVNAKQIKVLRRLVQIAGLLPGRAASKRLPQMLLLGPPGAGKTHFARAYFWLLGVQGIDGQGNAVRRTAVPKGFEPLNCGFLTSTDLSGRRELFGSRGLGPSIPNHDGVFERATLGTPGGTDYQCGGVVLLDEVANLPRDLQAAALTAMEERRVQRVGDGSWVDVGCHVVCATNVDPTKAFLSADDTGSQRGNPELQLRQDLVDRVDFTLGVPGLGDFAVSELAELVRRFVGRAIGQKPNEVEITQSAGALLEAAVHKGVLTSFRQLQSAANVVPGDSIVTEANFRWLLEKDRLIGLPLRKRQGGAGSPGARPTAVEKAASLALPRELQDTNLPTWTAQAIDALHDVAVVDTRERHRDMASADAEVRARYYVLTRKIPKRIRDRFRSAANVQANSLSSAVNAYARACGVAKGEELSLLLSAERRFDHQKFRPPRVEAGADESST